MTFVLEVVGENMHGQRWHGHVDLVAGGTFAGHLAVEATVGLLVSAQVRGGGIGLSALVAAVSGASVADPTHFFIFWSIILCFDDFSLPPRSPVGYEERVHGVTLSKGLALTAEISGGREAGLRAVRMFQVGLAVFPSTTADGGVQWI